MRESRAWHTPGRSEVYEIPGPENAAPVVLLAGALLREAITSGVSRVRLLPSGDCSFERDGEWHPVMQVPAKVFGALINRLKVMADLDIAKRAVQNGTLALRLDQETIAARLVVSVSATGAEEALIELPASHARPATA